MTDQTVVDLATKTIWVIMQVAAPVLLAAVITGLIISIFQAATQINEQTITFIPKIVAMFVALIICGPWILKTLTGFTVSLLSEIQLVGH
jgi:flagellar biosynthetic protein FliQ